MRGCPARRNDRARGGARRPSRRPVAGIFAQADAAAGNRLGLSGHIRNDANCWRRLREKPCASGCRREPELWNCHVDPGQLESAMLNLVLNARDAMPVRREYHRSTATIIPCAGPRPVPSRRLPAITSGSTSRIPGAGSRRTCRTRCSSRFSPPSRLDRAAASVCRRCMDLPASPAAGWSWRATLGSGTTVSLFLPRDRRRAPAPSPEPDGPAAVGQNQTVLVVEPDAELRATTCETLARAGYRPLAAADGSGALAHLVSDAADPSAADRG